MASAERTAFIHVGAHKTGTTSIQGLLAANEGSFRDAGVLIPRAGRIDPASAGHHNIAWQLGRDQRFRHDGGSFDDALREMSAADAPVVCLTSEDFELMHADGGALRALRDGLTGIGYEPHIVLYVRPQAEYLESLYATIVQDWDVDFSAFVDNIFANGIHASSCFEYDRLADAFADAFGEQNLIVRAYDAGAHADVLLRDFVETLSPDIHFESLVRPPRLNNRVSFARVLAARSRQVDAEVPFDIDEAAPFDPLTLLDLTRMMLRFGASNRRLRERYGASIGAAGAGILTREILTALLGDREAHRRKQLLRALTGKDAGAVAA